MKPVSIFLAIIVAVGVSACGGPAKDPAADRAAAEAKAAEDAAKAKAREAANAKREAERLAALWNYFDVPVEKGHQLQATINSTNDVDTDSQGPKPVQLVFRDHPSWGRSSYLVLKGGDFNCYGSCTVKVTVDDAAAKGMAGHRPVTDEAIAMFVNDSAALWRLTKGAKKLSIEFPVKIGGTRTATFDIAGLDRSKMPGFEKN